MDKLPVFVERKGCYAWCWAEQSEPGQWGASVTFEAAADHAVRKTMIPMVRQVLKNTFATGDEAMQAAIAVAHQRIDDDDTGL